MGLSAMLLGMHISRTLSASMRVLDEGFVVVGHQRQPLIFLLGEQV
jgi:hypothetical protein